MSMGVGRLRALGLENEPAGHSQVHEQAPPGKEAQNNEFASAPHAADAFSGQLRGERSVPADDGHLGQAHHHRRDPLAG